MGGALAGRVPSMPSLGSLVDAPRVRSGANAVAGLLVGYLVLQVLWPSPIGVLLQGVVIGGLTSLIAFGLALIYRSNRIINFAQGDLGGIPAALSFLLIKGNGIPYLLAVPVGLVASVALGAFVELVFIRRFFKSPRLILTVVTIGLSQILAGLTVALPTLLDFEGNTQSLDPPIDVRFNVGSVVFQANEVIAMLVVPVAIAALVGFFRYTSIGMAVRASAESADRAALLGVPVKRIQTIVWIVASVLAFVAIFLRSGIVGLPLGSVLGPTILVKALAAAVVGRMEKLPTIFFAAVGLGVVEAAISYSTGKTALVDPILFVIVLSALLLQRRGTRARVDDDQTSTWQAAREVRPTPPELARLPEVRWAKLGLSALLTAVLVLLPLALSDGQVNLAVVVITFAMLGTSMVVLTGWGGQVSLGHVGFLAIGAAVGGYLSATRGWDVSLAMVAGGIAGGVAALLIGLPALRIKGLFLAVVTLSFGLAVSSYALNPEYIRWLPQEDIPRADLFGRIAIDTEDRFYYFALACLVLVVGAVKGVRRSRTGRVLIGVRENPRAAQSYGVNATAAKLTGFVLSGFIAAFAGAMFVHHQQALGASFYTADQSRKAFTMVVIGGLGSVPGAMLGAGFIQGVGYFSDLFPEVIRPYLEFLTSGIGLIVVLLLLPGGFSQVFYGLRDRYLRQVAERRGILVPSLVADARGAAAGAPAASGGLGAGPHQAAPEVQADVEASLGHAALAIPDEGLFADRTPDEVFAPEPGPPPPSEASGRRADGARRPLKAGAGA